MLKVGDNMRNFYIFAINPDVKKMTQESPYELFHTLETIYYQSSDEIELSYVFLKQLIEPISIKELDIQLFKHYKENYFYTKYKNVHSMHDVYRKENTTLTLFRTYLKLQTNVVKPRFLEELQKNRKFFVCEVEEKDYFRIDSLEPIKVMN